MSRNVLGTKTLCGILSERDSIATDMQTTLDEATEPWGVKVERVEVKDVRLPKNLQRAMAAEAEATREAQAKIIAAEGEHKASRSLKHAAEVLGDSHAAMQVNRVLGCFNLRPSSHSFDISKLSTLSPQRRTAPSCFQFLWI